MTNKKRAIELFRKICKLLIDYHLQKTYLLTEDDMISEIEQALSEPRPHFDGEYYHLAWWHREIAEKFVGYDVMPYDGYGTFFSCKQYRSRFHCLNRSGFVVIANPYSKKEYETASHIAIPKETYERVIKD